jgi:hypothetical protein
VLQLQNLSKPDTIARKYAVTSVPEQGVSTSSTGVDRIGLQRKIDFLTAKLLELQGYVDARLALATKTSASASSVSKSRLPRMLRLCEAFELSEHESELLHALVVAMVSSDIS